MNTAPVIVDIFLELCKTTVPDFSCFDKVLLPPSIDVSQHGLQGEVGRTGQTAVKVASRKVLMEVDSQSWKNGDVSIPVFKCSTDFTVAWVRVGHLPADDLRESLENLKRGPHGQTNSIGIADRSRRVAYNGLIWRRFGDSVNVVDPDLRILNRIPSSSDL